MELKLSKAQLRRLIILVHLGEYMVNTHREEPEPAFSEVASRVYALAPQLDLQDLVQRDPEDNRWGLSEAMEEDAHKLSDAYDGEMFWEELVDRLVDRDLLRQRGEVAVLTMTAQERSDAATELEDRYWAEFEAHGVEHLTIVNE